MTQWEITARALGHPDEATMWQELYAKRALSVTTLANKFACSVNLIRARLRYCNVPVRKAG